MTIKVILLTFLSVSPASNFISAANASSPPNKPDFLNKFDLSPWAAYAENLKNCTAGDFILLDPVAVSTIVTAIELASRINIQVPQDKIERGLSKCKLSYKIIGPHKHKCKVIITPTASGPLHNTTPLECLFDQVDQAILSKRAEEFAKGAHQTLPNEAARQAAVRSCAVTH